MQMPTRAKLVHGCTVFRQKGDEPRDAMYKTATFLVDRFWGRSAEMADSLGVLLLTWNQGFYRYGLFDFGKLEKCIAKNMRTLKAYRQRSILDYTAREDERIEKLLSDFIGTLAIKKGKKAGVRSPVAAAKTLHLLAPDFFPLWDNKIALGYDCNYSRRPAQRYLSFIKKVQDVARNVTGVSLPAGKTLLKLIDEYNYAKFTRKWI